MKTLGVLGVGVSGGEPMLRPDIVDLLAYGSSQGLHMHLNSDGFRVAEQAREIFRAGVRSVNISLDGATAAEHDARRGRVGAFEDAWAALSALREARGLRAEPRITAVTVVTAGSLDRLEATTRAALDAGADRVGVVPVHDFGQGEDRRPDAGALDRARRVLARLHREGRLDNSLAYAVDLLPHALRGGESPLVCYAPASSVVVDCYGDVYPCFPRMERAQTVGCIPLVPLWRSRAYADVRKRLRTCRACLWNCHTEMNLTLPQWGRRGRRGA